jgi:hypothetical protein
VRPLSLCALTLSQAGAHSLALGSPQSSASCRAFSMADCVKRVDMKENFTVFLQTPRLSLLPYSHSQHSF